MQQRPERAVLAPAEFPALGKRDDRRDPVVRRRDHEAAALQAHDMEQRLVRSVAVGHGIPHTLAKPCAERLVVAFEPISHSTTRPFRRNFAGFDARGEREQKHGEEDFFQEKICDFFHLL